MSLTTRILASLGLYGRTAPEQIAQPQEEEIAVAEQASSPSPKPSCLTEAELAQVRGSTNVAQAKFLLDLKTGREGILDDLLDSEKNVTLEEALYEVDNLYTDFRQLLEQQMYPADSDALISKPGFNSLTEALLYTRNSGDIHTLKTASAKATLRKYVDITRADVGHEYISPSTGKPVHFETAAYSRLRDDIILSRKQLQEIKTAVGIDS